MLTLHKWKHVTYLGQSKAKPNPAGQKSVTLDPWNHQEEQQMLLQEQVQICDGDIQNSTAFF